MGVYAPTARMPANCFRCEYEMEVDCPCSVGIDLASNWRTSRHPDCPLVEVKEPHGDLIDKTEIMYKWEDNRLLITAPTVIEAEGE